MLNANANIIPGNDIFHRTLSSLYMVNSVSRNEQHLRAGIVHSRKGKLLHVLATVNDQ